MVTCGSTLTAGTFAWANPETASKEVAVGDYCIWDADDGVWRFIGNVGEVDGSCDDYYGGC